MHASLIVAAGLSLVAGATLGEDEPAATPGAQRSEVAEASAPTAPGARRLGPDDAAALQAFVRKGLADLDIPGAALGLVDHDQVVLESGLGLRRVGRPDAVTPRTLFMIGGTTRTLTTRLIAKFVDDGRLDWDGPVARAYPPFRLANGAASAGMSLRRLACGRSGLAGEALERRFDTPPGTPASSVFDRLARSAAAPDTAPSVDGDDLALAAAGYVAAHVARPRLEIGDAYDAVMQQEVLAPLGMADTTFDMARALAGDHAAPHGADIDGRSGPADEAMDFAIVPYRPAGGAWSSAHDLISFLRAGFEPPGGGRPDLGCGAVTESRSGIEIIRSEGRAPGYEVEVILLPQARIGAVLLTNSESGRRLLAPFLDRVLELAYGGAGQADVELASAAADARAESATERRGLIVPIPPGEAAKLAGEYACMRLGRLSVRRDGADVVFDFGSWRSVMAARRLDDGRTAFITVSPAAGRFEFIADRREGRRALVLRDGSREYVYLES